MQRWMTAVLAGVAVLLSTARVPAQAPAAPVTQELAHGQIIDSVTCSGDATQSYALYLPSYYSGTRTWPLLMGFHPSARGRAIVETYQAAAERYGYVVVASNNSRNNSWESSNKALTAMANDIFKRFPIGEGRFYLTGMSGGSRVALQVALATGKINGVIASSAGYPDSQTRKSLTFPVFGTAGTEDFNYVEMKLLGRELKTPHRIVIFEGGHQLPPPPVAMQAIEWLELQAMAAGKRAKDVELIDRLYSESLMRAEAQPSPADRAAALDGVVTDFKGLRDTASLAARVADLMKDKDIKKALSQAEKSDYAEARLLNELIELEQGLTSDDQRTVNLLRLRSLLTDLHKTATKPDDSTDRQQARRVIRAITAGSLDRTQDQDYRKMLESFRLPGSGRGGY